MNVMVRRVRGLRDLDLRNREIRRIFGRYELPRN